MMLQGIVDLIDRLGVLNDEARAFRQFVHSTVEEMIAAQSTIPIELRRVVNAMVQTGSRKMEQANAIAYLASEEASFITGAILDVDGGSNLVTAHVGPGTYAGSDGPLVVGGVAVAATES